MRYSQFSTAIESSESSTTCATTIPIVVALLVLAWTAGFRPWLERRRPHPSIPMLPGSHWLFGHLFWLLRLGFVEKQQTLADHADAKGRCSVWMGFLPSISLTAPKDAKKLLWNHHHRHCPPILEHHFARLVGTKNLLILNGREWKRYRSALSAGLARLDPRALRAIVEETVEALTKRLAAEMQTAKDAGTGDDESGGGGAVASPPSIAVESIHSLMKMVFVDVFGRSAFSHDFGCCAGLELCSFARAFEFMEGDIVDRCTRHPLFPSNLLYWIPTRRNAKFEQQRSLLRGVLSTIVEQRRLRTNGSTENSSRNRDILQAIMEAHNAKAGGTTAGEELSDDDLIDVLLSILLAGYETVSTTLTCAIYLIARHPEWESLCLDEIRTVTSTSSRPLADDLPTCKGVILEALRLYPVATGSSRTLEQDLVLDDGTILPGGCHAGVSFWSIHRSERWFPDPHAFRPDRWTQHQNGPQQQQQQPQQDRSSSSSSDIPEGNVDAFWAFSGGARSCPGRRYAIQEATLALAGLIQNLEFRIDPSVELELEWKAVVVSPKGGIPATVAIRTTTGTNSGW